MNRIPIGIEGAVLRVLPLVALVLLQLSGAAPLYAKDAVLKPSVSDDHSAKTSTKKSKKKSSSDDSQKAGGDDMPASRAGHSIVALVNDEPVTAYEIEQRAMMLSGGDVGKKAQANFQAMIKNPKTSERLKAILNEVIQANQGKSRDEIIAIFERRKKEFGMNMQKQAVEQARSSALPGVRKQALEELIDERLKMQEAKKQSVTIGDDDINRVLESIAQRNNMNQDQFKKQIGAGLDAMKTRIRATLSWNEVVKRRFGPLINVATRDVDKFVASSTASAQDDVELQLQLVRIAMPVKIETSGVAKRIQEAEQIRSKFSDCKSTSAVATGVPGAKFDELGRRRPSQFSEPTRTMLLNANDGEMLPPTVGEGGIELWVVCGRSVVKGSDEIRTQAEGELKQKEFEVMAKRYLKDLRQDAHIEYR